jgi:hypothetical protein
LRGLFFSLSWQKMCRSLSAGIEACCILRALCVLECFLLDPPRGQSCVLFFCLGLKMRFDRYEEADQLTRELLIWIGGEGPRKRGFVYYAEVSFDFRVDVRCSECFWVCGSTNVFAGTQASGQGHANPRQAVGGLQQGKVRIFSAEDHLEFQVS